MRGAGLEQVGTEQICSLPPSDLPPPINDQRGQLTRAGSKQLISKLSLLVLVKLPPPCLLPASFTTFPSQARRGGKLTSAGVAGMLPNNSI